MSDPLDETNLDLLVEAVARAMRREADGGDVLDRPPIVAVTEERLRVIVQEEAERGRAKAEEVCRRIVREEAERVFEKTMARVGLRIDDDHVDETRRMIDDLFRMHRSAGEFGKKVLAALASALGLVIAGLLGWDAMKGHAP